MTAQKPRFQHPKQLDAGIFQAEISSFALRLAAEGKAAKTIRTYTEAMQWFRRRPPARPGQLGAGEQAGHPAVDDLAGQCCSVRFKEVYVTAR